jgi:hypothetical protein
MSTDTRTPGGTGGTILAGSEAGVTSGFWVVGEPIPAVSGLRLLLFIALIALLGAWVLSMTRV